MRIVIAEDSIFRNSISEMLRAGGHQVEYVARSGDELMAHLNRSEQPDVAVLDIRMPPTKTDEGLVTAEEIRARWPSVGILLFSTHTLVPMAERLLALEGTGGLGYLSKDLIDNESELPTAAQRVGEGEQILDPQLVCELLRRRRRKSLDELLTDRERDVLRLIAEGWTNQAIATKLSLRVKTVEDYCGQVFAKLGLLSSCEHNQRVRAVLEWFRHNQ